MRLVGRTQHKTYIVEMTETEWMNRANRTPNVDPVRLAALVKAYRRKHDISQTDLCHISGLTRSRISQIENGVANITLSSLNKLLDVVTNGNRP